MRRILAWLVLILFVVGFCTLAVVALGAKNALFLLGVFAVGVALGGVFIWAMNEILGTYSRKGEM